MPVKLTQTVRPAWMFLVVAKCFMRQLLMILGIVEVGVNTDLELVKFTNGLVNASLSNETCCKNIKLKKLRIPK